MQNTKYMKRDQVQIDDRDQEAEDRLKRALQGVAIFIVLCLMAGFFVKIVFF